MLLLVSDKGVESENGANAGENAEPVFPQDREPMDTNVFCVYNLARGVFLSSKVTVADNADQPLNMLKVLVSGLALDAESGFWLSPLRATPSVPRLFPFDLVYLDWDHQVIDVAEISPGVEFPSYRREVVSALVLPLQTVQSTQTARGDRLIIGLEAEIEQQIAAFDTSSTTSVAVNPKPFSNGHRELTTSGSGKREAAPSAAVTAVFSAQVSSAITEPESGVFMVTERTDGDAAGHQSSTSLPAINGKLLTNLDPEGAIHAANSRAVAKFVPEIVSVAAQGREAAKAITEAKNGHAAIGERFVETDVPEIPTNDAKISTAARAPVIAITEVLLERPGPAVINGQHSGVEDIFSNWVDAPSLASAWISHNPASPSREIDALITPAPPEQVKSLETPNGSRPLAPDPLKTEKQVIATAVETHTAREEVPAATQARTSKDSTVSKLAAGPVDNGAPVSTTGQTRIANPQPLLAGTFTFAQYGLWRVSTPTAVNPVAAADASLAARPAASSCDVRSNDRPPREKVPEPVMADGQAVMVVAISESPAMKPAPEERKAAVGRDSMSAAASTKPLEEAIKRAVERDVVAGAVGQGPATKPPVAIPDKMEIPRHEVPGAETEGQSVQRAEALQNKPVNSKEIVPPNTLASKQPYGQKEPASPPQGELSLTLPLPGIRKAEQKGKLKISIQRVDVNGKAKEQTPSLGTRFKRWLNPVAPANSDRRKAHRRYVPGMVAHYFTGGAPKPHDVADISMTGFYLLTEDRWMPDTMIQMTLQKPCAKGERKQSITVLSKIVRGGSDGVAAQFVMPESLDPTSHDIQPSQATDRFALARFI